MSYAGGEHGIMAAIMALTAPPTWSGEPVRRGGKKGQRAHAKELFCEGCGDAGEVSLSCAACSAPFHPVCDDPPLDDLPPDWKCRKCRNQAVLAAKALASEKETEDMDVDDDEDMMVDETMEEKDPAEKEREEEERESRRKAKQLKYIFSIAIANGKALNPTPFEVPDHFQINQYQFPGTSRSQVKKPGGGKPKPTIIDLENFQVPVPVTVCYYCKRSCRVAPLLQCDYCPKQFHFDCLTPPLTSPPVGLWICPLHVEPFMESKHLKSWQLSKRVRLWDMTHKQIDRSSVIINFLKGSARKHPPFSSKVPISLTVPYDPPEESGNLVVKTSNTNLKFPDYNKMDPEKAKRTRELFACYDGLGTKKDPNGLSKLCELPLLDELSSKILTKADKIAPSPEVIDVEASTSSVGEKAHRDKNTDPESSKAFGNCVDAFLTAAEVLDKNEKSEEQRMSRLKALPIEQVYQLAARRLEDIDALCRTTPAAKPPPPVPQLIQPIKKSSTAPRLRPIAKHSIQLYCLNMCKVLKFSTQSIVFGTDRITEPGSSSFNPAPFVSCKRLSGMHAVLFYDRSHMQWELLNYSPFGIIVDSVYHGLKSAVQKEEEPKSEGDAIRDIINKRRGILLDTARNPRIQAAVKDATREHECRCEEAVDFSVLKVKHEGGATVCLGSEIQIGCLQLVVKSIDTEEAWPLQASKDFKLS